MSDLISVNVLFHVPEGLEFVAVDDIKEGLAGQCTNNSFDAPPKTGRVHLRCSAVNLEALIEALKTSRFLSVDKVTLILSESKIPASTFANTDETYEFVANATRSTPWASALAILDLPSTPSFRATFYKGQLKHSGKSQELAGWIGYAFSEHYADWKVNLTQYNVDVVGIWFRSETDVDAAKPSSECEPTLLMGLNVPVPDPKYRNRVHLGRTSLNPCIAHCLTRLADPKPGQLILDMCCGTGTIPIEGASKYPNTLWIGSEVHPKTLCMKAKGNMEHANLKNVELMLGDGRRLHFRDGCIDTVVSDWPWGLRESTYAQIQKLYPKFVRQMGNVLRVGGKALVVTQGQKLMNRVLAYPWCVAMWHTQAIIPIGIGGYDVYLYILQKMA
ncbi:S-adenosyl-L-methionine-dependent methyltransferase [Radiomyces spectabilis]|uniref:S-adenosyl-L-methionine-dependent methyltransferase n=1 Tax=Radiomyces spectabilis TaxID=64574 RepID=UPI00221EB3A0|nr:S-adenosyl-L-methionine-dependent methyltransferase [Radiomyces spectabilis]KAI8385030.1 S-adenosyl-L-methionine-dependent methyltransferase [Radiomyces spectabilis]